MLILLSALTDNKYRISSTFMICHVLDVNYISVTPLTQLWTHCKQPFDALAQEAHFVV